MIHLFHFLPEFVPGMKCSKDKDVDAVNELDLADALEKLKSNDPELTVLNANNHKDCNEEAIESIIKSISNNTYLKVPSLANAQIHDQHAKVSIQFILQKVEKYFLCHYKDKDRGCNTILKVGG